MQVAVVETLRFTNDALSAFRAHLTLLLRDIVASYPMSELSSASAMSDEMNWDHLLALFDNLYRPWSSKWYRRRDVSQLYSCARAVEQKRDELQAQVVALQEELDRERKHRQQLAEVEQQNECYLTELSQGNSKLRDDLAAKSRELRCLRDECKMLRRQIDIANRQLEMQQGEAECKTEQHRRALSRETARAQQIVQDLSEDLDRTRVERDELTQSIQELKQKHRQKRQAWADDRAKLVRCLDAATRATTTHLQDISRQIGPGGSLRQSLDAALSRSGSACQLPTRGYLERTGSALPSSNWGPSSVCSSPMGSGISHRIHAEVHHNVAHRSGEDDVAFATPGLVVGHPCLAPPGSLLTAQLHASVSGPEDPKPDSGKKVTGISVEADNDVPSTGKENRVLY